jgi:DNA helicase-2/ATP-dependent DNA helicase PcrA
MMAINHFTGNCVVLASAGSGKTSVLVERIKNLVDNHNIKQDNNNFFIF